MPATVEWLPALADTRICQPSANNSVAAVLLSKELLATSHSAILSRAMLRAKMVEVAQEEHVPSPHTPLQQSATPNAEE